MAEQTKEVPTELGAERLRTAHLLPGLLIAAIVVLIAIAVVSFH